MITKEEKELMLEAFIEFNRVMDDVEIAFKYTIDAYNLADLSRDIQNIGVGDISTGLKEIAIRMNRVDD